MAKSKKTKLVFFRTVMHDGVTYPPESTGEFDKKTADLLIEKGAAVPYTDLVPEPEPPADDDETTGGGEETGGADEPETGGNK